MHYQRRNSVLRRLLKKESTDYQDGYISAFEGTLSGHEPSLVSTYSKEYKRGQKEGIQDAKDYLSLK